MKIKLLEFGGYIPAILSARAALKSYDKRDSSYTQISYIFDYENQDKIFSGTIIGPEDKKLLEKLIVNILLIINSK